MSSASNRISPSHSDRGAPEVPHVELAGEWLDLRGEDAAAAEALQRHSKASCMGLPENHRKSKGL